MKHEIALKIKYIIDRAYDIVTIQMIGVVVFILIGLTVKFIGGDLYIKARTIYYSKTENTITDNIPKNDNDGVNSVLSEIPSDFEDEQTESDITTSDDSFINSEITETSLKNEYIWPISGKITALYGEQSSLFSGPDNSHTGIDIAAETGTNINAVADGVIVFSGYSEGYGNYIIIKHNEKLSTLYAHCSQLLYKKGTEVKKGEVVALVGNSGKATGSHLHLELLVNGKSVDPLWMLPSFSEL